jgi:SAM-dependent methyltransferase
MPDKYLFGDSDLAARRLEVVAECFGPSSRAFMTETVEQGPSLAMDLGCGPGYTTHLLADALACEAVVGLDASESFVDLAEASATARVSFRVHDVTSVPFPCGPSDLLYARFLLTHMTGVEDLIAMWATQLRPGGRLLVEEVDAIHTAVPAFATYLSIVEAMLSDGGHDLYAGRRLGMMRPPTTLTQLASRVACVPLANDRVARMFSMNIQTWKQCPFVKANYTLQSVQRLEDDLTQLAGTPASAQGNEWRLRQVVLERRY